MVILRVIQNGKTSPTKRVSCGITPSLLHVSLTCIFYATHGSSVWKMMLSPTTPAMFIIMLNVYSNRKDPFYEIKLCLIYKKKKIGRNIVRIIVQNKT